MLYERIKKKLMLQQCGVWYFFLGGGGGGGAGVRLGLNRRSQMNLKDLREKIKFFYQTLTFSWHPLGTVFHKKYFLKKVMLGPATRVNKDKKENNIE